MGPRPEEKQQEEVRRIGLCLCISCWDVIAQKGLMCVKCSNKKDQKGCYHFVCSKPECNSNFVYIIGIITDSTKQNSMQQTSSSNNE